LFKPKSYGKKGKGKGKIGKKGEGKKAHGWDCWNFPKRR
jgi:hypothetical protein